MRILALIFALMLAPFAAVAAPGEHPAAVEAAQGECCDAGHHVGTGCTVQCAVVPAPTGLPAASKRRGRHPLPGDVAFNAIIPSGTLDPPRIG